MLVDGRGARDRLVRVRSAQLRGPNRFVRVGLAPCDEVYRRRDMSLPQNPAFREAARLGYQRDRWRRAAPAQPPSARAVSRALAACAGG
jgi:hypothetical protein